ncbi:MAG: hypothetical protein ACJAYU_005381 [Bradymonadia bacterium]|jgi:hypothetical protein
MQRIIDETPALQAADLARDRQWEDLIARALCAEPSSDPIIAAVRAGAIVGALRNVIRAWRSAPEVDLSALALRAIAELESGLGEST